jgi:hypothetical protein
VNVVASCDDLREKIIALGESCKVLFGRVVLRAPEGVLRLGWALAKLSTGPILAGVPALAQGFIKLSAALWSSPIAPT